MFERPDEWRHVRRLIDVFQFTQQHTFRAPDHIVGPNNYDALARVDAFRMLTRWRKKTALGIWSVKEFYCTPNDTGMHQAIDDTRRAVDAIRAAGGSVHYFVMDEPFLSGLSLRCGGPALGPTADRLQTYMSAVQSAYPTIRIGLIEAYPSFTPGDFPSMLELTRRRGTLPAFVQVDVDLRAVRPPPRNDFPNDMRRLKELCAQYGIPFGIIIWGYNGDADTLFALDAKNSRTHSDKRFQPGNPCPRNSASRAGHSQALA